MALKPDRKYHIGTDISFFMNATAERGGIVMFQGAGGSGVAMDDANATVNPTGAVASGSIPAGILLNDMVNLDLTRQHINWHKDEVQLGGKVTVLTNGQITTNVVDNGVNPVAGDPVYAVSQTFNGNTRVWTLSTTAPTDSGVPQDERNRALTLEKYRVGTFLSREDADGYVKVQVNL